MSILNKKITLTSDYFFAYISSLSLSFTLLIISSYIPEYGLIPTLDNIKGEFVIVVEGNKNNNDTNINNDYIVDSINYYIDNGLSKKDAIKLVSNINKINKNYLYTLYHKEDL